MQPRDRERPDANRKSRRHDLALPSARSRHGHGRRPGAARLVVRNGAGRVVADQPIRPGKPARFKLRGESGKHRVTVEDAAGTVLDEQWLTLAPKTDITCDRGPYAELMMRIQQIDRDLPRDPQALDHQGPLYRFLDLVEPRPRLHPQGRQVLHLRRADRPGLLARPPASPTGCSGTTSARNRAARRPTWWADAIGEGWFTYEDAKQYAVRRIPILADTEYVFTEGVWSAWKASGDDAWMARQLPRLERPSPI